MKAPTNAEMKKLNIEEVCYACGYPCFSTDEWAQMRDPNWPSHLFVPFHAFCAEDQGLEMA